MKASYEMTLKIRVNHDVDDLVMMKSDREFANDVCEMICDEATRAGGVATFEILESKVNVEKKG